MAKPPRQDQDLTDPNIESEDKTYVGPAPTDRPFSESTYESDDSEVTDARFRLGKEEIPSDNHSDATETSAESMIFGQTDEPASCPDKTVLRPNPLPKRSTSPRKRILGRLVIIEGENVGRSIDLFQGRVILGRSEDADICLFDIQVSREHAEISADNQKVLIKDLGSGNGTLINDNPCDQSNLVQGDLITLGDHVLRFERPGESREEIAPNQTTADPASVSPPNQPQALVALDAIKQKRRRRAIETRGRNRKNLLIILSMAALAVGATVIAFAFIAKDDPGIPQGPSPQEIAQRSFSIGQQRFREELYEQALPFFEEAVSNMPEHSRANEYLRASTREISAKEAISRGQELLAQSDYEGARRALAEVPQDSLQIQAAKRTIERANQAEVRTIIIHAESLLELDRLDDAESSFKDALIILEDHQGAKAGLQQIEERRQQLSRMTAAQRAAAQRAAAAREEEEMERASSEVREAIGAGENQFNQGDFAFALDTFLELRLNENPEISQPARQKAEAMRTFTPAYDRGMSAADNRNPQEAISQLRLAERQARIISANGETHREIKTRLAEMYNLESRVAFNSERYAIAYKHWSDALSLVPDHSPSQEGMRDIIRLAEEIYLEAYMVRSITPSEAAQKFRLVMSMTPPNSETHTKARDRLAELQR